MVYVLQAQQLAEQARQAEAAADAKEQVEAHGLPSVILAYVLCIALPCNFNLTAFSSQYQLQATSTHSSLAFQLHSTSVALVRSQHIVHESVHMEAAPASVTCKHLCICEGTAAGRAGTPG